jgi:tetratricopeptide (TPR) repeat protein
MTSESQAGPEWDFFVSYTSADWEWANWIASTLKDAGYRVLIQERDREWGKDWLDEVQRALAGGARTIAVLSPSYPASVYCQAEWQAAFEADMTGAGRKLLPARIVDCEVPVFLRKRVWIDLFDLAERETRALLLDSASAVCEAARPTRPPFPGRAAASGSSREVEALFGLPPKTRFFTGRKRDLKVLEREFASGDEVTVATIRGMGGVGKSQLALEYARRHGSDYDRIYWVSATEPAALADRFARLAVELGLGLIDDAVSLSEQLRAKLRELPRWLLVLDNAQSVADVRPWIPAGLGPAGAAGHVLLTTRRRGEFHALGRVLELKLLAPADAIALLRARNPGISTDIAAEIARELGLLPLALEQAAAYMDRNKVNAALYLRLLQEHTFELYDKGVVADREEDRRDTIATLWDISLAQIKAENPAAVELMDLCAYLAPDPVPLELFTKHAELLPPALSSAVASPLGFMGLVGVLADYSMLLLTNTSLQVHRLLQGAIRLHHERAETPPDARDRALALVLASRPGDPDRPATWRSWAQLLPHLREVGREATDNDELRMAACDACLYLLARSDAAGCLELAQDLFDRWRRRFGDEERLTLTVAVYLARALRELGRRSEARERAERTLASLHRGPGPDDGLTLTATNDLARYLRELRFFQRAYDLDRDTHTRRQRLLGADDPATLTSASNLASDLSRLGQVSEARDLDKDTLARRERRLGADHPQTLDSASNLAIDLMELGEIERALKLSRDTLDLRKSVQGPDHAATLQHATNLGINLGLVGTDVGGDDGRQLLEEGGELLQATLERLIRLRGEDHPSTLITAINLADNWHERGKTRAALDLGEVTLVRCRRELGDDDEDTETCAKNVAKYRSALGLGDTLG